MLFLHQASRRVAEESARDTLPVAATDNGWRCPQDGAALLQHLRGQHPVPDLVPTGVQATAASPLLPLRSAHVPAGVCPPPGGQAGRQTLLSIVHQHPTAG